MEAIEFGLGRFDDRRLEKGGPRCTPPWLSDRVAVSGGLPDDGRKK
ncbi:MAG: hypothetical protein ABSD08_21955 [Xanthobacteraceae bacterium]|jgi:hypothetical protein